MKTRTVLVSCAMTLAVAGLGLVAACSSDDKPPATGGGGATIPGTSSSGGSDGGTPNGDASSAAGLCNDAGALSEDAGAAAVTARVLYLNEPPPPLGGPIEPGRYVLVELYDIKNPDGGIPNSEGDGGGPPPPQPFAAQKQLTLPDVGHYVIVEAEGSPGALGAPRTSGGYLRVVDKTLVLTEACPGTTLVQTLPYTAAGPQIAVQRNGRREVYQIVR